MKNILIALAIIAQALLFSWLGYHIGHDQCQVRILRTTALPGGSWLGTTAPDSTIYKPINSK